MKLTMPNPTQLQIVTPYTYGIVFLSLLSELRFRAG